MQMIMWVCPKCGSFMHGKPEDICSNCGAHVIDTGIKMETWITLSEEEKSSLKQELIRTYAPNLNPAARDSRIEEEKREEERYQYIPKCPTCGSPNIRPTDALEAAYNPQSHHSKTAFKSFVCRNCGYAW